MAKLILFCGQPGNYKTYLASRLAAKLGYMYVPTSAFGEFNPFECSDISAFRQRRYDSIYTFLMQFNGAACNVILDGGYPDPSLRQRFIDLPWSSTTIIACISTQEDKRINRLVMRAADIDDLESTTARHILEEGPREWKRDGFKFDFSAEMPSSQQSNNLLIFDADRLSLLVASSMKQDAIGEKVIKLLHNIIEDLRNHPLPSGYQRSIVQHFDKLASEYDGSTEWREDSAILDSMVLSIEKSKQQVLDIATGTGICGKHFRDRGHEVTGIDISTNMLQIANSRLDHTAICDAHNLCFSDGAFDVVLMRQCLHYLDTTRALQEARRVLSVGGTIVISCAYWPNVKTVAAWQDFKSKTQPLRNKIITLPYLETVVTEVGFRIRSKQFQTIQIRNVHLASLENNWRPPMGGWEKFLSEFSARMAVESPEMKVHFDGRVFKYEQNWITLHAER